MTATCIKRVQSCAKVYLLHILVCDFILSRYQISVCVCVKRLMFHLLKLKAGSNLKSENYFKSSLLSNARNSGYKMHSKMHGCVNYGKHCTRAAAVKLR